MQSKAVMEPKEIAGWQESNQNKLWKKIKKDPFVPIGVFGCIGAIIYGYYNHKNRGNISTSTYLMKLRVKAQGMVVGAMALGVVWGMYREHQAKKEKETKK